VLRDKPHKQEEKERVRLALLREALALSATHGFASLGLREVARAANIAPTSFYRHFADMAEIGRALVEEQIAPLLRELALAGRAGDARAIARALVQTMLTAVESQPEVVRFLVAERAGAFSFLREALNRELAVLAEALPAPGATTAVALLLDGFARALDLAQPERGVERERLLSALTAVLHHD
jgi:TetR/AcrR family transcriptional regulator, fatty acid biosynthesis regulator